MATITDFQEWLDNNLDNDDIDEIYNLYQSVTGQSPIGSFDSSENNGRLFVKNLELVNNQILMLASDLAVKSFLNKLDNDYGGDCGSVEGQYGFESNMRRKD